MIFSRTLVDNWYFSSKYIELPFDEKNSSQFTNEYVKLHFKY